MAQRDWMSIMVRGARCLAGVPFGIAIVDPATGRIAFHNPAMAALLGQPVPSSLAAVAALGVVATKDRQRFAAITGSLGDEDSYSVIDAEVTHPNGQVKEITVRVAHLHALRGAGSVLAVTATDFDNTFDYADLELSLNPPGEIHVVYDLDLVTVATDHRLVEYGMDPSALDGAHALLMAHPEDAVEVSPKVRAVVTGDAPEAQYTARVIGPGAAWTSVSITLSRFRGIDEDVLLITNTPRDVFQEDLDDQVLDDQERAVARALLAGQRPTVIAEELAVSVHTVRHRMTNLFRKLGVDSQVELYRRYQAADET